MDWKNSLGVCYRKKSAKLQAVFLPKFIELPANLRVVHNEKVSHCVHMRNTIGDCQKCSQSRDSGYKSYKDDIWFKYRQLGDFPLCNEN
jgi:hypothetical protein